MLRRPHALVARPAAVVMIACAAVHVIGAVQHWSPVLSLATIAVAGMCLRCVPHLWVSPRVDDWVWVTLGSAAMLVLHLIMLVQPIGSGHAHAADPLPVDSTVDTLTVLGLVLPLLGLVLAWWALGARPYRSLGVGVPIDDHRADRGHHR